MKLEIPIIVGFDDLESLLDDLKKLQTYKLFEGDEMVLVNIEDVAKVLMDHVKAQKSVKGDMVSRKAVYDAVECMNFASDEERRYGFSLLEQIPTAQSKIIRCKECKHWDTSWQNDYAPNYHYCPLVDGTRRDDFYCADAERRTDE